MRARSEREQVVFVGASRLASTPPAMRGFLSFRDVCVCSVAFLDRFPVHLSWLPIGSNPLVWAVRRACPSVIRRQARMEYTTFRCRVKRAGRNSQFSHG